MKFLIFCLSAVLIRSRRGYRKKVERNSKMKVIYSLLLETRERLKLRSLLTTRYNGSNLTVLILMVLRQVLKIKMKLFRGALAEVANKVIKEAIVGLWMCSFRIRQPKEMTILIFWCSSRNFNLFQIGVLYRHRFQPRAKKHLNRLMQCFQTLAFSPIRSHLKFKT